MRQNITGHWFQYQVALGSPGGFVRDSYETSYALRSARISSSDFGESLTQRQERVPKGKILIDSTGKCLVTGSGLWMFGSYELSS